MPSIADIRTKFPQYHDLTDQQLADGVYKKFYSDIPRSEFDQKLGIAPAAAPPPGAGPGSREYADWAAQAARAGQALPQVSDPYAGQHGLVDQIAAGTSAALNSVPIAGPTLLSGAEALRGSIGGGRGMTPDQISAETKSNEAANPIAATTGAVTGTVLPFVAGGAIPGVSRLLGMGGGLLSRVGFGAVSGAGINAADTYARGGDQQDMTNSAMVGGAFGGALPVIGKGIGTVFNSAVGRNVPKAARNLTRAFKDDGIDPATVNQRLQDLGPGSMVMDLGPNLQRQAGAVASVPGSGQQVIRRAVDTRAAQAGQRLRGDIGATLGTGPELNAMQDQVISAQSRAATPLYDTVRDKPVDIRSGNFAFVFGTKYGKQALAQAQALAETDGGGVARPTIGLVDYAKQALDDMASAARRQGNNNEARAIGNLTRTLTAEADRIAPGYKAARNAFAGHAKVLDAMDMGSTVFSKDMSPGQLQSAMANMSQSERDGLIHAARASIEEKLGNAAISDAATLRRLFKPGNFNDAKLRIILGDSAANDVLKAIARETTFGTTGHVVAGNSETAARQAAQAEVAPELGRIQRPQGLTGLLFSAFDAARNKMQGVAQPKINRAMANTHVSGRLSPEQIRQLRLAAKPPSKALIGPATGGLLTGDKKPLQITIGR